MYIMPSYTIFGAIRGPVLNYNPLKFGTLIIFDMIVRQRSIVLRE